MKREPFVMVSGGMITEEEEDLLLSQILLIIFRTGNAKITVEEADP